MLLVLKKSEMQPAEPPIYDVAVVKHTPIGGSTSHYHVWLMGLKLQLETSPVSTILVTDIT
jgi:hypothetical protein